MQKQEGLSHTKQWLLYTVIIGSLPFVIRLTVILLSKGHNWELLWHPIDFVFMGLTVNISNINETNHKKKHREMTVFWSVILIIMLSITIGLLHFSEIAVETILDEQAALYTSILLCIVSLIYSYNVINNKS
jgi:hydrogenase-4 membrane subunit HyfE